MEKIIITDILTLISDIIEIFYYPEDFLIEKYNLNCKLNDLEVEYVRLFIANYDEKIISLYLSTYLNITPWNLIEKLNKIFKLANVKLNKDFNERIDHINVILEFFYLLMNSNIDKSYKIKFFNNYILPFKKIPPQIRKRTNNKLYILGANKLDKLCQKF